jgi:ribonuclease HI
MITLQFDGLFRSLPSSPKRVHKAGFMGYGWLILRDQVIIARGHGVVAHSNNATSNIAEYLALIEGLEALTDLGVQKEPVTVRGDSKCVIDQMCGAASVNAPGMKPLHRRAKRLCRHFLYITWIWTPRQENKDADSLTRRAMRQVRADPIRLEEAVQALDPRSLNHARSNQFLPLLDLRLYLPVNQKLHHQ